MMISQAKLVFLTEEGETICRIYISPYAAQEEKGKVTVFKQKRG